MDQSINKTTSNCEVFNISNVTDNVEEKCLSLGKNTQQDKECQQQASYLNRVLEAYSDCV